MVKEVSVWYHKDGDHLVILEIPWWMPAYERIVNAFFCPCCGVSGFLSRMEWYNVFTYRIWSRMLGLYHKKEKILVRVPVESGCLVSEAIWHDHKGTCFMDDCPVK